MKFAVTAYYGADVDAHRAAYLTGVLAVFALRGAGGRAWMCGRSARRLGWRKPLRVPPLFLLAILVFAASLVWVVTERPVGAAIAGAFIALVLVVSIVSRAWRSTEFRFDGFEFADKATEFEWGRLKAADYPDPGADRGTGQEAIAGEGDRRPDAAPHPGHGADHVRGGGTGRPERLPPQAAAADRPRERPRGDPRHALFLDRARAGRGGAGGRIRRRRYRRFTSAGRRRTRSPANLHFVLFGTGNVPWMVHTLIRRADVPDDRKPRIIVA